jgi:hypothetical protein
VKNALNVVPSNGIANFFDDRLPTRASSITLLQLRIN